MYIRLAICWLFSPWATSWEAAHSVSVRLAQPLTGLTAEAPRWRRHTPSLRSRCRMRAMSVVAPAARIRRGPRSRRRTAWSSSAWPASRTPRSSAADARAQVSRAVLRPGPGGPGRGGPGPGRAPRRWPGSRTRDCHRPGPRWRGPRGRQFLVPGGARYPHQPSRGGGSPARSRRCAGRPGADIPDQAEGGDGAGAGFGDLGLGQGRLRASVDAGEVRHRGGPLGDVPGRGREVSPAQRDHAQNAAGDPGVPVGRQRLGGGQGGLGFDGGVGEPARGQVHARAEDRRDRLGGDAVQLVVAGRPEDAVRLVDLAQVHQGGGQRQQRLGVAGIRRHPGAAAAASRKAAREAKNGIVHPSRSAAPAASEKPCPAASLTDSPSSRDLPMPCSPSTRTTPPAPRRARRSNSPTARRSASRPYTTPPSADHTGSAAFLPIPGE